MMVIDLDGFKAVNDKHGHHAGDALLIEVARRFNRVVAGLRGKTGWPGPSPASPWRGWAATSSSCSSTC
jgi:hypothetical protein